VTPKAEVLIIRPGATPADLTPEAIRTYMAQPYVRKLLAAYQNGATGKPGQVGTLHVRHDWWCGALAGKECHCDPDVEVVWRPAPKGPRR
jgi:hypothetical protein